MVGSAFHIDYHSDTATVERADPTRLLLRSRLVEHLAELVLEDAHGVRLVRQREAERFAGVLGRLDRDAAAVLVDHRHATLQLREDGVIALKMNRRRHPQILLDHADKIPVQVPMLNPIVVAIANQQQRLFPACIQPDAVTRIELSFFCAGTAKGFDELAILVELQQNWLEHISFHEEIGIAESRLNYQ